MAFSVKILADSKNPIGGRLITMVLTYPRCVHSEFMTHRMFSRNAASSRAIPVAKMLAEIKQDPFIPLVWGRNQRGMQAGKEHDKPAQCEIVWLRACRAALDSADQLQSLGLHKQIINRVVEPWMWITVIATGVDHAWENFFKLRCHPEAEPHMQKIAYMTRTEIDRSDWNVLGYDVSNRDHLPLIGFPGDEGLNACDKRRVSVARCARVSYLTHEGKRDVEADITLHNRLQESGHWSPFEHVACTDEADRGQGGNFGRGWCQYRKEFLDEYCRKAPR